MLLSGVGERKGGGSLGRGVEGKRGYRGGVQRGG